MTSEEPANDFKGFYKSYRAFYITPNFNDINRILKKDGYAINIGWNSGGIGKTNGFNIEEILILNLNSFEKDVFCVIDKKM